MTALIPKAELHNHFEGVSPPAMVKRLAARNGLTLAPDMFDAHGEFAWEAFGDFLEAYDRASASIRTAQDYRDVAYEYLEACAREGTIYLETFISPDHGLDVGMDYGTLVEAISQGIDEAESDFGIIGRIVVTCVRHRGPERAVAIANTMVSNPHPYVVGFGMGGDEAAYTCSDFAPAFNIASNAGYGCTVHAGEVCGPESVRDALNSLPVSRIGHGVRSIEDSKLVQELSRKKIVLEVCPSSNMALGVYHGPSDHPLLRLMEAGCRVTIGSDDPPFFKTTIGQEYERAHQNFGLSHAKLLGLTANAIEGAFVDKKTKAKLRAKL